MSTTSKPEITPTTLADTEMIISAAVVDVGPNGEPLPDDAAPKTPTSSAAPSVADVVAAIPELDEVRKVYGEAGVQVVVAEAHAAHVAGEHEKLSASIPGWSDPQQRAEIVQEIRAHALAQGFTEAEINAVTDARTVRLAYTAMQRDKLRADAAQADGDTPTQTTQTRRRTERGRNLAKLAEQVQRTGRQRDAMGWVIESGLAD